jgi:Fe-S-cluster containining protein
MILLPLANPTHSACRGCPARCCHNLSVLISQPASSREIADLRWRLHFDTVTLYIQDGLWYMKIAGRCRYLQDDSLCSIYDERPMQCRTHEPPFCERYMLPDYIVITTPEELDRYLATSTTSSGQGRGASEPGNGKIVG